MKRQIYIDGENFVHILLSSLREKGLITGRKDLVNFDIQYLIKAACMPRPAKPQKITYYGAKLQLFSGDKKLKQQSQDMISWNAQWVNVLQRQGILYIKCGHLKLRDSHKCTQCGSIDQIFIEKGVDVGLAVDIVSDAFSKKVEEIIIFSADSDILPAIKRAHGTGAKVIYAAYAQGVNRALTTMVDEVWTYSADQIEEAYNRANT